MKRRPSHVVLVAAALASSCAHQEAAEKTEGGPRATAVPSPPHDEAPPADRRPPSSEAFRAVIEAELALERGDPKAAEDLLREAILHDPESAWLRLRLGHVEVALGDVDAARESARFALERSPHNVEAHRLLALTYVLSGERGAAERALKDALEQEPGDRPSSTMLAELYLEQGRDHDAERVIEALMAREPDATDGWLTLARLFADRGDVTRALSYAERALARDEHDLDGLDVKLTLLYAQGEFTDAVPVAEAIAKERGDSSRTRQLYLTALLLADEQDEAAEVAANWLREDKSEEMLLVVSDAFEEAGFPERAREMLLAESGGAPTRRVAVTAGRLALQSGDLEEARRLLCGVGVEEGSDWFTFARSLCVRALLLDGRLAEAKQAVAGALPESSTSARLLGGLVDIARRDATVVGRAELMERLERALEEAPGEPELLDVAVRAREVLDGATAARAVVDEALRERPEDAEVLMILARLLERQGDARAAIAIAERVMARTDHPDVDLLNFLAFTLADHGVRAEEAERLAWRAVLRGPLNGYIIDTLGWAQHVAGDNAAARSTLERADRLSPHEPEILLHLAIVDRALGDDEGARRALLRAQQLPGDDEELRRRISELWSELGTDGT